MNVLAFDTSGGTLAAACSFEGRLASASAAPGTRHAEGLMKAIDTCLAGAGGDRKSIDLFACALGPGSFTGLRIGMATAKGLSLASGKPWIGVPTLDCAAFGKEGFPGIVAPILDGRKGRVYTALYERGLRISDWLDIAPADLLPRLDAFSEVLFTGPDAELFAEYAQERPGFIIDTEDASSPSRRAEAMAILAARLFIEQGASDDASGPLYLREPEIG